MTNQFLFTRPVITEKSMATSSNGQYTFIVPAIISKHQIKEAAKTYFGVDVVKINTIKIPAKTKVAGKLRHRVTIAAKKKAILTLKSGQTIKVFETKG